MFDLKENPFVLLGVTPRSTRAEIHEAVEDALFDVESVDDERRLDIARQGLIAPNERLRAELCYLLEIRPAEARKVMAAETSDEWLVFADSAAGLSRANATLQAASLSPGIELAEVFFNRLLDSWEEISEPGALRTVNEERAISGFSEAQPSDVRKALAELRDFHATRLLQHLDADERLPQFLSSQLTERLIPERRVGERFVASVLDAYANFKGGALVGSSDRALHKLQAYSQSGSESDFLQFERELEKWDEIAQPLQLAQETKGGDEAHSKELYETIRATAIELANDEDRHDEALRITELSARVFAELPGASQFLQKDEETLQNVIANKTRDRLLLPLASAVNEAQEDLFWTSQQILSHGFSANSPDPIGAIWKNYAKLLTSETELEMRDTGAQIVRNLSIALFNDQQAIPQAQALNAQLAADQEWFSPEVHKQIKDDEAHLSRNLSLETMLGAMRKQEWKRAKELCDELLLSASSTEKAELRNLERIIDKKISESRTQKVVWGGIAAAVLGVIVFNAIDSPSRDSGSSYGDVDAYSDMVELPADVSPVPTPPSSIDDTLSDIQIETPPIDEEIAPPAYGAGNLTLSQLRYCIRQGERLDLARVMVEDFSQQTRFNSAINDYNARCGNFRYDPSDMARAQSELQSMRGQLSADARGIVGEATPAPVYAPPSPRTDGSEFFIDEEGNLRSEDPGLTEPYGLDAESGEDYP